MVVKKTRFTARANKLVLWRLLPIALLVLFGAFYFYVDDDWSQRSRGGLVCVALIVNGLLMTIGQRRGAWDRELVPDETESADTETTLDSD